jgi:PAS domain S-box-containing protein
MTADVTDPPGARPAPGDLAEENRILRERNRALLGYLRARVDAMLLMLECSAGNADALDDDMLIDLDPLGTISDSFTEVLGNLRRTNDLLRKEVSERQRAEEALRESEERLKDLFDNVADMIQSVDPEGSFLFVNRAWKETLGYDDAEVPSLRLFDVISPEHRGQCVEIFRRLMAGEDMGTVQVTFLTRDGRRIEAEGTASCRMVGGKCVSTRSIFRDVTERKKLEAALANAEKIEAVGSLAGGIAHDFNNLLTAVLGNISLSRASAGDGSPAAAQLDAAETACLRARDLTLKLLTFSRGGAPIRRTASIDQIVRDSAEFALRGSRSRAEFRFEEGLLPAEVDGGQFSQVVRNLVTNASQAMEGGGTVTVTGRNVLPGDPLLPPTLKGAPKGYVMISVEDGGEGIPADRLGKIFDPFYTTRKDGTGMGLPVSYSIVKAHDGAISVESRQGKGTVFRIFLPASTRTAVPAPPPVAAPPPEPRSSRKKRVLVMDDEEIVRSVALEILSTIGYDCVGVPDGQAALDAWKEAMADGKPFDGAIMDLTIPGGMGGKEAMERLLALDPSACGIVSSGYSNDPVMAEFREFGFRGVIAKPYRIRELRDLLGKILDGG